MSVIIFIAIMVIRGLEKMDGIGWKSKPTLKMLCLLSSPLRSEGSGLCGYVTTPATSVPFFTSHMALRLRGETHDAYP